MRIVAWSCLLLGLLAIPPLPAREVGGVDVPERLEVAGETLRLNGAGVRSRFFFDIYVGALYLVRSADSAEEAIAMPGPKRLLMHFVYDEVGRDRLVAAWQEGFAGNLPDERRAALEERIERFNGHFDTVRAGDRITLDYVPGMGTRIGVNGEVRGTVSGEDFQQAWLSIFLGPEPADRELKRGLLGGG